jgi:Ca2+-binding RTX toxin-like protein
MAVLQSYYGANTSYNDSSNTYTLDSKDYYEAIWDSGGLDEITMGENSNAVIDLRAATLEYEVGGAGFVSYNANAKGGYTIANGVVIENAKGGGGNDIITGNDANNIIYGGSGAGVKDILTGNLGADIFISCIADATTDLLFADTITDFINGTDKIGLEDRFFSDLSFSNDGGGTKIVDNISSKILFWLDGIDYSLIDSEDFITTDFV